jgi:hypothetical protein
VESVTSHAVEFDDRWDIREGSGVEIASGLKADRSEVLAFVVHGEDEETRRKKFEMLKQVAGLMHTLINQRRVGKWNALVEALTPDLQLSPTKITEARMMSSARTAILESKDFVSASAIADAADYSTKNPSSQPNRWKRSRQIFAITYKGVDLYPVYALNPEQGFRPIPIVGEVLRLFENKNGWETAFWFASLNSYLKNRTPKDLLRTDPTGVLRAAQAEAVGLQHG